MFNNSSISAVTVNHCSVSNFCTYTQHFTSMMCDQHVQVNVQVFLIIQLQTDQSQTVQQHENLQLIVASQVDQLLSPVLAPFALISKPL